MENEDDFGYPGWEELQKSNAMNGEGEQDKPSAADRQAKENNSAGTVLHAGESPYNSPGTPREPDAEAEDSWVIYDKPAKTGEKRPDKPTKQTLLYALICIVSFAILALIGFRTIHFWKPATCTEPETCSICGKTRGEALNHVWKNATCTEPEICIRCGAMRGDALDHDWIPATCMEPETCSRCGLMRGELADHDWADATCEEPETCVVCGATRGYALGHDWEDATCEEPQTCRRCRLTQGAALGHDWKDATCTEPETCRRCSETRGAALGHDWKDATYDRPRTCRRCELTDGQPLKRPNPSGYTHDGIQRAAELASERDAWSSSSWRYTIMGRDEDNGKYATNDPRELYVPSDSELLAEPFKMKIRAEGGKCITFMPIPEEGHGILGKVGDYDYTSSSHSRDYHKLVTVLATTRRGGITYYFFVTEDGRAGWNGSDLFETP